MEHILKEHILNSDSDLIVIIGEKKELDKLYLKYSP